MKNLFIIILIVIPINGYINAQIHPITESIHPYRANYKLYKTNSFEQYSQRVKNQSTTLKDKLFGSVTEVRLKKNSGFSPTFFIDNLSQINYEILSTPKSRGSESQNRVRFYINYITDQLGNVHACSAWFPSLVAFSDEEIEGILINAMSHKFEYVKKPRDVASFYHSIITYYLIKPDEIEQL